MCRHGADAGMSRCAWEGRDGVRRLSAVAPASRRSTDVQGSQNLRSSPNPKLLPTLPQPTQVSISSHLVPHSSCSLLGKLSPRPSAAASRPRPARYGFQAQLRLLFLVGRLNAFAASQLASPFNAILTETAAELQGHCPRCCWWYWPAIVAAAEAQPQG